MSQTKKYDKSFIIKKINLEMIMKKYFYNVLLLLKNIKNYGFITVLKIILYEFFYIVKYRDLASLSHDDKDSDSYENSTNKNMYDTPYIPTPFYFLKVICLFLKKIKEDDLLILDLGCGYSRVQYFFSSHFKSFFFGVDINKTIIDKLKKKNIKNSYFLNLNLRKVKDLELLIKNTKKIKKKKNLLIFFSDSFDVNLLKKVINSLSREFNFNCILINVKNTTFLSKKYSTLFVKKFKNPERNIKIFKTRLSR